jgi:hypothetical protein
MVHRGGSDRTKLLHFSGQFYDKYHSWPTDLKYLSSNKLRHSESRISASSLGQGSFYPSKLL